MMKSLTGKCVSNQIVIAPLLFVRKAAVVSDLMQETAEDAWEKIKKARQKAVSFCHEMIREAEVTGNLEAKAIFEAHKTLVCDVVLEELIYQKITQEHLPPVMAIMAAGDEIKITLSASCDEMISEKTADVDDVVSYYLEALGAYDTGNFSQIDKKVIVMASELTPAETMRFPKEYVAGLVTKTGSAVSHVSILSKSLGIPALYSVAVSEAYDGMLAVLDGEKNLLIVNPDEETLKSYQLAKELSAKNTKNSLHNIKSGPWKYYANVSNLKEAQDAFANGAEGIGLYRSEALFLGREEMPTQEEQFNVYKNLLELACGREVVIRVLDVGSDKKCPYFLMPEEKNPALGLRGVRFLLANPDILETQLRALFRAAKYGKLSILFPMITTMEEVYKLKEYCKGFDSKVRIGMMIETPAAAMITDLIAAECDFISIGTNDLVQYMMAADRDSDLADDFAVSEHPALKRLLRQVIHDAHTAGCEVCICGELAWNTQMFPSFEEWKVDVLSVAGGSS